MEYYDVSGPSYGGVDVPKCWKMKFKWFVQTIGFEESPNAPSIYVRKKTGALISIHVDDPWIRANKRFNANGEPVPQEESELWEIYSLLKSQFQVKDLKILSQEVSIDYLSMRVSVDANLNIRIDNDAKVTKLLEATSMVDCNPVKVPLTKQNVQDMYDALHPARVLDSVGFG